MYWFMCVLWGHFSLSNSPGILAQWLDIHICVNKFSLFRYFHPFSGGFSISRMTICFTLRVQLTFMSFNHMTLFPLIYWHCIAPFSWALMDRLPQSEALRHLPFAELIRFLFLIVNELNRRINAETDFEIISDTSEIPPRPHLPPAVRIGQELSAATVARPVNFAVQRAVVERPITAIIRVGHIVIIGRWNFNGYAY